MPQRWSEPCNIYLIEDQKLTLIDIAHSDPACMEALTSALSEIGYTWKNIKQVIYTHPHLDHMGGGVHLRNCHSIHQVGCAMSSEGDLNFYLRSWRNMQSYFTSRYPETTGMVSGDEIKHVLEENFPPGGNVHLDQTVKEGEIISLGKRKLQVFFSPGHHPHHITLYEPGQKLLFSGDFLLYRGPAIISLAGGNPAIYQSSLRRFKKMLADGLEVSSVLPGHGPILPDAMALVEATLEMLERHRERVINSLAAGPKNIVEIAVDFFGTLEEQKFIGVPLGLIDTILEWLLSEKAINCQELNGIKYFSLRYDR